MVLKIVLFVTICITFPFRFALTWWFGLIIIFNITIIIHHQHRNHHHHHWWRSQRCCFPPPSKLYRTRARQSCLEAFGGGRAGEGNEHDSHDQHDNHHSSLSWWYFELSRPTESNHWWLVCLIVCIGAVYAHCWRQIWSTIWNIQPTTDYNYWTSIIL